MSKIQDWIKQRLCWVNVLSLVSQNSGSIVSFSLSSYHQPESQAQQDSGNYETYFINSKKNEPPFLYSRGQVCIHGGHALVFLETIFPPRPPLVHMSRRDETIVFVQLSVVVSAICCENSFPDAIVTNDVTAWTIPTYVNVDKFSATWHVVGSLSVPNILHSFLPHRFLWWWHLGIISGDDVAWRV